MKDHSATKKVAQKLLQRQLPASNRSVNRRVLLSAAASTAAAVAITNALKNRRANPMYGTQSALKRASRKITGLAENQLKEHGQHIVEPMIDLTKQVVEAADSSPEGRKLVGEIESYLSSRSVTTSQQRSGIS